MVYFKTTIRSADNSGFQIAKCIKIYGGMKRRSAKLGDKILICLKKFKHRQKLEKKKTYFGLLSTISKKTLRKDGSFLKFDKNKVWIYSLQEKLIANRIYGPIPKEIKYKKYNFLVKQLNSFYNPII